MPARRDAQDSNPPPSSNAGLSTINSLLALRDTAERGLVGLLEVELWSLQTLPPRRS